MSNNSIRLLPETLRTLAFGSISGAYMGIGTAFLNPIRIFFIQNETDQTMTFSFDGINDHFVLPSTSFLLIDVTSNTSIKAGIFCIAEGTRIYVKQTNMAPSVGAVYLSVFYAYDVVP